ncbi:hypothetical protein [Enterovibrio sp. FF113]|uniref:hypothetical protein n=1 Tax=Enterovibrio sp. FF113 TaxID=3230010 RepID=UPI00352E7682
MTEFYFHFSEMVKNPSIWSSLLDSTAKVVSILTFFIAAAAAITAYYQLKLSRRQNSGNFYKEYLNLCSNNLSYAKGIKPPKTEQIDREGYWWFVSKMLFIFEQVLLESSNDEQWKNTILHQLKKHKKHLSTSGTVERNEWEPELTTLIKLALKDE